MNYNQTMKKEHIANLISALSKSNDWISAAELASHIHVTTRTVRNYVNEINSLYSTTVIISSHHGYKWVRGLNSTVLFAYGQYNEYDTPDKRMHHILRTLLFRETVKGTFTTSVNELCDSMSISSRTLEMDINNIRSYIKPYDVILQLKKDQLSLNGKEADIRRLIYHIIMERYDNDITNKALSDIYPALNCGEIENVIQHILKKNSLELSTFHRSPLLLYMIIQIMRTSNKHFVLAEEVEISNIQNLNEYQSAQEIRDFLIRFMDLHFPWWEVYYLTILLVCFCHRTDYTNYSSSTMIDSFISSVLKQIEERNKISYHYDNFALKMADFLERLKLQCRYHIDILNPLVFSLKSTAPVNHDIACWIMADFCEEFDCSITRNQIADFEILLLTYYRQRRNRQVPISCTLICPDYNDLKDMITAKINSHFQKQISIDYIMDKFNISDQPRTELAISISPVNRFKHEIQISPAMRSTDYASIQTAILDIENEKRYKHFEMYMRSYSSADLFIRNHDFTSMERAVEYMYKKLKDSGCVNEGFLKSVLKRERIDSTAHFNMVAVPHSSSTSVVRNSICVVLNDKPFPWGKRRVNMVVMIAMDKTLNADFERFYDLFIRLFESKNTMKLLLASNNYDSFLNAISHIGKNQL